MLHFQYKPFHTKRDLICKKVSIMSVLYFACFLFSLAFTSFAKECDPTASIKALQKYSSCAQRTRTGVLIGFGYNVNLPHAASDLALLGINRNDIPKGIIATGYAKCDCAYSVCLTLKQSQRLFDINVDRANKQVARITASRSKPCCAIQRALTALFFTFGKERLMSVPDLVHYASEGKWKNLGSALLMKSWCKDLSQCNHLAKEISEGCENMNLGCSPPTPKACDSAGHYCCASNNTCCQYHGSITRSSNRIFSARANQAYWCCPLQGASCCSSSTSCCPKEYPVCCGATNSCCFVNYPVCCFPGTSQAYCCVASTPVCLGDRKCGPLDPGMEPVSGKVTRKTEEIYV